MRFASLMLALLVSGAAVAAQLEPARPAELAEEPITAAPPPMGTLLKRLAMRGDLAGNLGDVYDNRDRGHSLAQVQWYPQLRRVVYDEADKAAQRDWALARTILPYVVIGNSSTSGSPDRGGSNPRTLYLNPAGVAFAWQQYRHSNLYVYPEHRDYDPGAFGIDHAGDAFPLNTPYLVTSRGSSGSDRPFLHALLWTSAAFDTQVKQQLYARKLLAPTLQMILRRSLKGVDSDEDYLSGKAHPTAFDGSRLNPEAMAALASRITLDDLPPLAAVRVLDESASRQGRDYFLDQQPERWVDTPAAVGRIYRGPRPVYEMVLDASESTDANNRDLTYHWRVLRGDPERVKIEPLDDAGQRVRLTVPFENEPMPSPEDPAVQHRRVDVGLFVHNGVYHSPPAVVSIAMPRHQRMTLDHHGRVLEIGYGAMTSRFAGPAEQLVPADRWPKLLEHVLGDAAKAELLRQFMTAEDRAALQRMASHRDALRAEAERAEALLAEVQAKLEAEQDPAKREQYEQVRDKAVAFRDDTARAAATPFADWTDPDTGRDARAVVGSALSDLHGRLGLFLDHQQQLADVGAMPPEAFLDRLADLRLLQRGDAGWTLQSVATDRPITRADQLTVFERNQLDALHAWVLHRLTAGHVPAPVDLKPDPRLAIPHVWRDVYTYNLQDTMTGWTRYHAGKTLTFDAEGDLLTAAGAVPIDYIVHGDDPWKATLQMHRNE